MNSQQASPEQVKACSSGLGLRALSALILGPATLLLLMLGGIPFVALIVVAFTLSLREWRRMALQISRPGLYTLAGFIYLAACMLSFVLLRLCFAQGAWLNLCLLIAVWASDIGAYFTGKTFGGPKLAPRISPKKNLGRDGRQHGVLRPCPNFTLCFGALYSRPRYHDRDWFTAGSAVIRCGLPVWRRWASGRSFDLQIQAADRAQGYRPSYSGPWRTA